MERLAQNASFPYLTACSRVLGLFGRAEEHLNVPAHAEDHRASVNACAASFGHMRRSCAETTETGEATGFGVA